MSATNSKKIIILTSPSGGGKTSVKSRLMAALNKELSFSVSATTRKIRGNEQEGVDYHFINEEVFKNHSSNGKWSIQGCTMVQPFRK
jgi:guanylate kinase